GAGGAVGGVGRAPRAGAALPSGRVFPPSPPPPPPPPRRGGAARAPPAARSGWAAQLPLSALRRARQHRPPRAAGGTDLARARRPLVRRPARRGAGVIRWPGARLRGRPPHRRDRGAG